MFIFALSFFLFGAIIGSFLNVLILRHGVKAISGRSACPACAHTLEAVDLVPIFSWLFLRGRCRFCGSGISIQYPLVELLTALVFAFIGVAPLTLTAQLAALPVAALLIAISVYDLRHTIIPDSWVVAFAGFSLVFSVIYLDLIHQLPAVVPLLLAGPFSALPFFALWYVSGGRWMGLGDGKLAWGIGWLLGPLYAFAAIISAFILGALISVFILLPLSSPVFWSFVKRFTPTGTSRKSAWGFTMKSEVAFGPFLATACLIVWISILYHIDPFAAVLGGPL